MPTFDTPEPISVTVEVGVGDIRIVTDERSDTVVDVQPSDSSRKADVTAAQRTRVEYANGKLVVKGPKGWRQYGFRSPRESIHVEIAVPKGSAIDADAGVGTVTVHGRLGECHAKAGVGDVQLEETGRARINTGAGDVSVDHVQGDADVATGSGALRVGSVDGAAVIKNSNGEIRVGHVAGELRVKGANGRISIEAAGANVIATTANGDIRLGEVARGVVEAKTAMGKIEVGVRDGVAAWLDLNTHFGSVHNELVDSEQPRAGEDTVNVQAHTSFGDVVIRRSSPLANGAARDAE